MTAAVYIGVAVLIKITENSKAKTELLTSCLSPLNRLHALLIMEVPHPAIRCKLSGCHTYLAHSLPNAMSHNYHALALHLVFQALL